MTIKAGHLTLVTSLYSHDISLFFFFILMDYQTGLWEKYVVTEDWSQSNLYILYINPTKIHMRKGLSRYM